MSPRLVNLVLGILLAGSVVAHLVRSGSTGGAPAATESTAPAEAPGKAPRPPVEHHLARDLVGACNTELRAARSELASTREELAQRVEPRSRFDGAEREPAMEARVAPLLGVALGKLPGVTAHPVECRGDVCQVRVSASTRAEATKAWTAMKTSGELREVSDGYASEGGEPVIDVATGTGGFDVELYMFTRSAADMTAQLEAFLAAFEESSAMTLCAQTAPDTGVLEVRISVVADEARLVAAIGGSLAGTAVGRCVADRLLAALATVPVPSGAKYGVVYASLVSPHGA